MTKENYYIKTFGTFTKCEIPKREPDYISTSKKPYDWCDDYDGKFIPKVSSSYWYSEEGVYRLSDHWDSVSSCFWIIDVLKSRFGYKNICGFCRWEDFHKITTYCTYSDEFTVENEIIEYPLELEGKNNVAIEFKSLQLCTFTKDWILDEHPNHHSNIVEIVEDITWEDINTFTNEELVELEF